MKKYYVFKKLGQNLELVGRSKDEFDTFIRNNSDDVIEWQAHEIEESLNLGDITEENPLVAECLDNGNEWVVCYPDSESIVYTQKNFDVLDELSIEIDDYLIYFKEENLLNKDEKDLIA
jgi:hypothetical protein